MPGGLGFPSQGCWRVFMAQWWASRKNGARRGQPSGSFNAFYDLALGAAHHKSCRISLVKAVPRVHPGSRTGNKVSRLRAEERQCHCQISEVELLSVQRLWKVQSATEALSVSPSILGFTHLSTHWPHVFTTLFLSPAVPLNRNILTHFIILQGWLK